MIYILLTHDRKIEHYKKDTLRAVSRETRPGIFKKWAVRDPI